MLACQLVQVDHQHAGKATRRGEKWGGKGHTFVGYFVGVAAQELALLRLRWSQRYLGVVLEAAAGQDAAAEGGHIGRPARRPVPRLVRRRTALLQTGGTR